MEKIENIPNEAAPIISKLDPDDISRCVNCNLICSLKLNYKEAQQMIEYECENGHKQNILLRDYLVNFNKFSLSKEKCKLCNKIQKEVKGNMFYCPKCDIFICNLCLENHKENNHNMIFIQRYDSICKLHSNLYYFYCMKCKKNLCIYCQSLHKSHDIINLYELNYSEESKNLKEEIKNIENKINDLDILKQNIISIIDKLKDSSELELKYIKILLYTYEYEENQNNLNYNIIKNLKDFENKFNLNIVKLYEKIYDEGKKYISFIQNLFNINLSPFNNNIKILRYHTSDISHIDKLKDGRLISCSFDNTLNIYKNNTYELQLSIKEHSNWIRSFTQLKDERIITCSSDKTIKIIRLIEEDKYQIDQILKGHTNEVCKIIEIRENELISISRDKSMKIWKLNNENKFECIKTIIFQNSDHWSLNIFKINKREFVTSSYGDKCIKFWNLNDYSNIATINNIEIIYGFKSIYLLENDILCVGGSESKGFYLIKISNHQLIKNIIGPKRIYCITKCMNGLLLCSIIDKEGNNTLIIYKYENQNLEKVYEKEKAHDKVIYSCVELNDGTIVSGGCDYLIKLWRK